MESDLVLGVALAPAALGLALIRGHRADGQVLDRDLIATASAAEQARGAIMRTYATATKHGYRIRGIGVTCLDTDPAAAFRLVDSLRRVGVRNVVVVDPDPTGPVASVAAAHALDMVRGPNDDQPNDDAGRHRRPAESSPTARRVAFGSLGVAAVLTAAVAAIVVPFTSAEAPRAPERPALPPTSTSPADSTIARPAPPATFTAPREPVADTEPAPTFESLQPPPEPAPEAPGTPEPPASTEHLPAGQDGPRAPGPAA